MKEVKLYFASFFLFFSEGDHLSEAQAYTYKGPALELLQLL